MTLNGTVHEPVQIRRLARTFAAHITQIRDEHEGSYQGLDIESMYSCLGVKRRLLRTTKIVCSDPIDDDDKLIFK